MGLSTCLVLGSFQVPLEPSVWSGGSCCCAGVQLQRVQLGHSDHPVRVCVRQLEMLAPHLSGGLLARHRLVAETQSQRTSRQR